jgi:nitroreductase
MLYSQSDHNRSLSNSSRQGISRRVFIKDVSLFSLLVLAGSGLLQACQLPPSKSSAASAALPTEKTTISPAATSPSTLMDALKNRKSATTFQSQPLPKEILLDLLWSAWGINRPDSGKRTAPSAMNAQEIDIYVLLSDGVFIYDAKANQIVSVLAQDIRVKIGTQGLIKDAPVQLLFVADYAKYRIGSQSQKELYSACHTGFIGQNVYLYCASQGLASRFYAGLDRAALKESLKLRDDQAIVFAQAVGYPK